MTVYKAPKPRPKKKSPRKPLKKTAMKAWRRKPDSFARIYHSVARQKFVSGLPCCVCRGGPCEGHHIKSEGIARKAHYTMIVPLCARHHDEYHDIGRETFRRKYWNIDLEALARETERKWQDYSNQVKEKIA